MIIPVMHNANCFHNAFWAKRSQEMTRGMPGGELGEDFLWHNKHCLRGTRKA